MINRLADSSVPRAPQHPQRGGPSPSALSDVREASEPVRKLILENPTAALAIAFLAGVALAWWVKRS